MDHRYDFGDMTLDNIVYVRSVQVDELPAELQVKINSSGMDSNSVVAVHNANGERLALVRDRKLAFILARQNDMSPVNVH
ncbi:MAG: DUF1150 domain-containing protein [Rhodobacter sp.]|jgi:hypothetical protein|nr:DUF1150 domain-containing protein [Rhodobacter sp.]